MASAISTDDVGVAAGVAVEVAREMSMRRELKFCKEIDLYVLGKTVVMQVNLNFCQLHRAFLYVLADHLSSRVNVIRHNEDWRLLHHLRPYVACPRTIWT